MRWWCSVLLGAGIWQQPYRVLECLLVENNPAALIAQPLPLDHVRGALHITAWSLFALDHSCLPFCMVLVHRQSVTPGWKMHLLLHPILLLRIHTQAAVFGA
jgi:hypothetical protein